MKSDIFMDARNMRHVGHENSYSEFQRQLFNPITIQHISKEVTKLLEGVDKYGKSIIVTDNVISNVLSSVLDNPRMEIGDIYTRYIIENNKKDMFVSIVSRTIEIIVQQIKTEARVIKTNESLSIWNSIRGEQNKLGLLAHSQIKTRERRPQTFAFNMNY